MKSAESGFENAIKLCTKLKKSTTVCDSELAFNKAELILKSTPHQP